MDTTTIASIAKKTGLALLEATALLVISTLVSKGLRDSTTNVSKYLAQAFRFTASKIQQRKAA
jgi:hypothetical protein